MNRIADLPNQDDCTKRWVEAAQDGQVDAFENLYRLYHQRIYLYARRLTGSISAAEEVVQDTFIKTWQNLNSFRSESKFYTWLRTIASRIVIDRLRIKNAKIWQDSSEYEDVYSGSNSNLGQVKDLEKLISRLPDGARNIFVMHDIEGYKHQEIAQLIGIAPGTSKAQLFRARKLLRESLI